MAWVGSTWMNQSRAMSKRFQEELSKKINSVTEERAEEAKIIYFSQLLE